MEPIAADEMVIEYVGQNIRQVPPPFLCGASAKRWMVLANRRLCVM